MNLAERLIQVMNKKSRRIIGLMSGMSLDGIDLACVDIEGEFPKLKIKLQSTHYMPYPAQLKKLLLNA